MKQFKFLAVSPAGAEFVYMSDTAHKVPSKSARAICDALNAARYGLTGDDIWTIHDGNAITLETTAAGSQSFGVRGGKIYEKRPRRVCEW